MHDVNGSNNNMPDSVVFRLLDRAISNGLWVATYAQVGAYWRAAFTMDTVTATGSGPWNLAWKSPHAKMPKSVKLKVKLAAATFGSSFTVSQDDVAIPANSDGSYTIDFMKLKLNVTAGSAGVGRAASSVGSLSVRRTASEIVFEGSISSACRATVSSLSGRVVTSGVFAAGSETGVLRMDRSQAGESLVAVLQPLDGSASRALHLAPVW